MAWDVLDFTIFGAMLLGAGVIFSLAKRKADNTAYRIAVGVALWLLSAWLFQNAAREQGSARGGLKG